MITIDAQPEWLPPSSQEAKVTATYAMNVAIANATNIIANIDLTGLVDVELLNKTVHAVERTTTYNVGDIVNANGLIPGLVFECQTAGTTADTLIDFSGLNWGESIIDGTVTWAIKRYLLSEGDAFEIGLDGNWQPTNRFTYSQSWEVSPDGNLMPKAGA